MWYLVVKAEPDFCVSALILYSCHFRKEKKGVKIHVPVSRFPINISASGVSHVGGNISFIYIYGVLSVQSRNLLKKAMKVGFAGLRAFVNLGSFCCRLSST